MVGVAQVDSESPGNNGKAVLNLHTCYDTLWEFGTKIDPLKDQNDASWELLNADEDSNSSRRDPESVHKISAMPSSEDFPIDLLSVLSTSESYLMDSIEELTADDMDKLIKTSLLNCLVGKVDDSVIPISASTLYSSMMIPARPIGTMVDIKRSSYKKLSKFLQFCEKSGLLTCKIKNGELFVTSINRKHVWYNLS